MKYRFSNYYESSAAFDLCETESKSKYDNWSHSLLCILHVIPVERITRASYK